MSSNMCACTSGGPVVLAVASVMIENIGPDMVT
jgi:hypothetical protein